VGFCTNRESGYDSRGTPQNGHFYQNPVENIFCQNEVGGWGGGVGAKIIYPEFTKKSKKSIFGL